MAASMRQDKTQNETQGLKTWNKQSELLKTQLHGITNHISYHGNKILKLTGREKAKTENSD